MRGKRGMRDKGCVNTLRWSRRGSSWSLALLRATFFMRPGRFQGSWRFGRPENTRTKRTMRTKGVCGHSALEKTRVGIPRHGAGFGGKGCFLCLLRVCRAVQSPNELPPCHLLQKKSARKARKGSFSRAGLPDFPRSRTVCRKTSPRKDCEPQVSALRSPGFPVEARGVGDLHATLSKESRTRGRR
jgi:hypothetical protein